MSKSTCIWDLGRRYPIKDDFYQDLRTEAVRRGMEKGGTSGWEASTFVCVIKKSLFR